MASKSVSVNTFVNPMTIKMFGIYNSVEVILALCSLLHSLSLPSWSINVQMEMFHSWKFLWNDRKKRTNLLCDDHSKDEKRQRGVERKGQRPKMIHCARYDERIRNWWCACVLFFFGNISAIWLWIVDISFVDVFFFQIFLFRENF